MLFGTQVIGEAFHKIRNGSERILLAGGADNKVNQFCAMGFKRLGMISSNHIKEEAMRPFNRLRDGFVMGQGACMLIIESYDSALKRNAVILGEIAGYGTAIDGKSISDASVKGKTYAMQRAINDAEISYKDIGYINAHGTSTLSNDRAEFTAIKKVFQENAEQIPVNITKSLIGHTFAACGAIQNLVCLNGLEEQRIHMNLHLEPCDENCRLNYVNRTVEIETEYCITNTSGIGGGNASLIFKKYNRESYE